VVPLGKDPIAAVVALMAVRLMPEDQFRQLCDRTLEGAADSCAATLGFSLIPHTAAHGCTRLHPCTYCGFPVERENLNRDYAEAFGRRACKACIDGDLEARFARRMTRP